MTISKTLLDTYTPLSDQIETRELAVILGQLETLISSGVDGDVVEFGCFMGTTSPFLQRLLQATDAKKQLWVYDSFDGLPEKSAHDQSPLGQDFKRGELRATKAEFIGNFRRAHLALPIICKKWFHEVDHDELPEKICFAFLDGDYYKSIRASLGLVLPRMAPGGVIIIDDYDNPKLPGVGRAVHDLRVKPIQLTHSLAILQC